LINSDSEILSSFIVFVCVSSSSNSSDGLSLLTSIGFSRISSFSVSMNSSESVFSSASSCAFRSASSLSRARRNSSAFFSASILLFSANFFSSSDLRFSSSRVSFFYF